MPKKHLEFPDEFQNQVVAMVLKLVSAELGRFLLFSPLLSLSQGVYSNKNKSNMEIEYERKHWHEDPMHPTRYEDSDVKVVSNSMLMSLSEWKQSGVYLNFLKHHDYIHNVDTYFRQDGKIVGVLTLLRTDENKPFTEAEIKLLENLQPFMEYTLSKVFLPQRITERNQLQQKYQLTSRELDVMEYALTGLSNKELVRYLNMSLPTLRTHLQNIYSKVGVHSTSELISKVLRKITMDISPNL